MATPKTGGYSHGMMNLLVPPEIAQAANRHAKKHDVPIRKVMLFILKMLVEEIYFDEVIGWMEEDGALPRRALEDDHE